MLPNPRDTPDFGRLTAAFSWDIPGHYNIGVDVCDKWAHEPGRIALIHKPPAGRPRRVHLRRYPQAVESGRELDAERRHRQR
jgi:hypothetical protein